MTVLALAGECPSCRKRVDDLSGTDPTRTALRISEGAPLPAHCALCDAPATRAVSVRRVARSGMPVEARRILGAIAFIFGVAPLAIAIAKRGPGCGLHVLLTALGTVCALVFWLLYLGAVTGFLWPVLAIIAAAAASSSRRRGTPARLRARRPVRVDVPLCGRCRRSALEPIAVDTEAYAMTFLVDRRFAERASAGAASFAG